MSNDLAKAIVTLVGSILSCLATSTILIFYIDLRQTQHSFRHALIFNLTLAEFINSLNNSVSGIYLLASHENLTSSPACTFNGWIGQWSVQAVDFSILAIAIVTLITIVFENYHVSSTKKFLICASTWIVPSITASIAAGLQKITPVSGNWCWISPEPTYLRYALTHGWRYSIIFATICIYIYIWIHLKLHYRNLSLSILPYREIESNGDTADQTASGEKFITTPCWMEQLEAPEESSAKSGDNGSALISYNGDFIRVAKSGNGNSSMQTPATQVGVTISVQPTTSAKTELPVRSSSSEHMSHSRATSFGQQHKSRSKHAERNIQRMMLLNAYPLFYVIFWIPGILNRLFEALGHPNQILAIAQGLTQYIGLANALTYGFDQHLKHKFSHHVSRWRRRYLHAVF